MKVAVDISLYPLQDDLIPPIVDVIERSKPDHVVLETTYSWVNSKRRSSSFPKPYSPLKY